MPRKHFYFATCLSLIGILAAFCVTEIVLRMAGKPSKPVGWKPDVITEESNEMGYRGRPFNPQPGEEVTVLLGDSQVHAVSCSFDWMPEKRLERYLNKKVDHPQKVVSIAGPSWGTDQEYLSLKEYFKHYRANHVALWFTPENDFTNNAYPIDGNRLKPTFWLENGRLQGPNYQLGESVLPLGLRLGVVFDRWFPFTFLDEFWSKRHLPQRADFEERSFQSFQRSQPSARILYSIELTRALLHQTKKIAEENGASFTLFLAQEEGRKARIEKRQYGKNLNSTFRDLPVHWIEVETPGPFVGPKDFHYNEHATDEIMRKLASIIVSQ